jgi:hypothetical protein
MTTNALLLLACLAADDVAFPVFERDPWAGFAPGATVTRATTTLKRTAEETLTVKAVEKQGTTLGVSRPGEGEADVPHVFLSLSAILVDVAKLKATGRSGKLVTIGARRVRAAVREFGPEGGFGPVVRVVTAEEFPGGIVEVSYSAEDDRNKVAVSYAFKALERVKAAGQDVECARYELTATPGKGKRVEGTFWLSSRVPGLLVRSWLRQSEGREVEERFVEVTRFAARP